MDSIKKEEGRYDRQLVMPEIGSSGQEKLAKASVLVIGAGGLGSPVLLYLAAAGIGRIGIVDGDQVSVSNLNRQVLHPEGHLGMNKAESAKKQLLKLNSSLEIIAYPYLLTADNASQLIEGYDFVVDCVDNFESKFLINDACVLLKKAFCHAGVLRFEGQVMTVIPQETTCMRCVFEEIPKKGEVPENSSVGIVGAAAGMIGCLQALEAIRYLLDAGELLTNRMLILDGLFMKPRCVNFRKRNPACRVCGSSRDIFDVRVNRSEYL